MLRSSSAFILDGSPIIVRGLQLSNLISSNTNHLVGFIEPKSERIRMTSLFVFIIFFLSGKFSERCEFERKDV